MLYNIVFPGSNADFDKCITKVGEAYWPAARYRSRCSAIQIVDDLDEVMRSRVETQLREIVASESQAQLYAAMNKDITALPLPFLDRFHLFFLQRKWDFELRQLLGAPSMKEQLFYLHRDEAGSGGGNYSKQSGNYNHFINVVAATARLISYFTSSDNVKACLLKDAERESSGNRTRSRSPQRKASDLKIAADEIAYSSSDSLRILQLMFAAFYHDLGKTVVDPRHGMEGAIILSDHSSRSWYQLNRVARQYTKEDFEHEDLLFLSDMLLYHDLFGTLGTGESGYLKFVDVLDRIKKYCLKHREESQAHKWSRRYLFDLWLLNVADIMVSQERKFVLQRDWWGKKSAAEQKCQKFLGGDKARSLVHDLRIAYKLLEEHNSAKHTDSTSNLLRQALMFTERHAIERIRRLTVAGLARPLGVCREEHLSESMRSYVAHEESLTGSIVRSIQSVGNYQEFCNRFSYIGHMDYALGFFERIGQRALEMVCDELKGDKRPTRWIRSVDAEPLGNDENAEECLWKVQAKFFVDNYVSTTIQILGHLLLREKSIESPRNLEFNDARNRLTPEKIDSIISLVGPYRTRRSTQLILQTIFYW